MAMNLTHAHEHDADDPLAYLNAIEAVALAVLTLPKCHHCHDRHELMPLPGNGWAVEHFHEADCPNHEDNQPAAIAPAQLTQTNHDPGPDDQ